MKKTQIFTLWLISIILQIFPFITSAAQPQFCAGFNEGYRSIMGNLVVIPICPLSPLTPLGMTDFQNGIGFGIRAAQGSSNSQNSDGKYAVSDEGLARNLKSIIGFRDRIDYLYPAIQNGRITLVDGKVDFTFPSNSPLPNYVSELLEGNEQWMRERNGVIYLVVYNPTNITISNLGIDLYKDGSCAAKGTPIYRSFTLQLSAPLYPTKMNAYTFRTSFDNDTFGVNGNSCLIISKAWQ